MSAESQDPQGDGLERLLEELDALEAAGRPESEAAQEAAQEGAQQAAQLAERFGLEVEDVAGILAGRAAMADLVKMEDAASGSTGLPLPVLPKDFELLGELGRGGMGVVYRARQVSLDREVAVKVMRPSEILFAESLKRFGRETRALAKLRHPHIAAIHEVGESDGHLYFTMDLIEGGTLAEYMGRRKRRIPLAFAVRVLRQVGSAVSFVHGHGMVHRDLKPANILLDNENNAHVVDFGLALDPAAHATLTATGRLMGTPAYMAPEQALGERALVTERTDIYGLGVLLYELVCGAPPFGGGSIIETVRAVVQDEPITPRRLRKDLPRSLENVILKAMAKDPAKRYGTAEALVRDLERFTGGEAVEARPPGLWDRAVLHVRRRRVVYAGVLGAAAAAAALLMPGGPRWGRGLGESPETRLAMIEDLERSGDGRAASALAAASWKAIADETKFSGALDKLSFRALCAKLRPFEAGEVGDRDDALLTLKAEVASYRKRGGDPVRAALLECGLLEQQRPKADWADKSALLDALESAYERERSRVYGNSIAQGTDIMADQRALLEDRFLGLMRTGDHPLRRPAAAAVWRVEPLGMQPPMDRDLVAREEFALIGPDLILGRWVASQYPSSLEKRLRALAWTSQAPSHARASIDVAGLVDLVLDEDRDLSHRSRALGYLCVLLELPTSFANGVRREPAADGGRSGAGAKGEWTMTLDEPAARRLALAAREGAGLSREDWLTLAADVLIQSLAEQPDKRALNHGLRAWFYERLGLALPAKGQAIGPWWQTQRERGVLGAFVDACAVEGVTVGSAAEPDSRRLLAEALLAESDVTRVRWIHELLAMTQPEGVPVPRFLWVEGNGKEKSVPPRLRDQWRSAVGAAWPEEGRVLELALMRWPGGIGRPEVMWSDAAPLGAAPLALSSGSLDVGDAFWTGRWANTGFSSLEFYRGHTPGGSVSYKDIQPGCVRLWVYASDTYFGGEPAVVLRRALLSRERGTYAMRRVYDDDPRTELRLASGDVRVVADWTWDLIKEVGEDRFALLAHVVPGHRPGTARPEAPKRLAGVEAWAAALIEGIAESTMPGATAPTGGGVDEVDIRVAARLAYDLLDQVEVGEASLALAGHIGGHPAEYASQESGHPSELNDLQFIGAAVAFRALAMPHSVTEADLVLRGGGSTILGVQERTILSESAEVRRLAREAMRDSRARFTEGEIRAMHRVAERHGESDQLESQPLGVILRGPLSLSIAELRRLWIAATILVIALALLLPGHLPDRRKLALRVISYAYFVAMLLLTSYSLGLASVITGMTAVRHGRSARAEGRWPVVGTSLMLFFVGLLGMDYFGEPAIGHVVASAALAVAFFAHALRGLHLARRGERQLGSTIAWVAGALTLPHTLAWTAFLLGSNPFEALLVPWLGVVHLAELVALAALFMMFLSPFYQRPSYS